MELSELRESARGEAGADRTHPHSLPASLRGSRNGVGHGREREQLSAVPDSSLERHGPGSPRNVSDEPGRFRSRGAADSSRDGRLIPNG